jgi:hypothetical protein
VARILVETDRGEMTLSENLVTGNLEDAGYAAQLVERVGWALAVAERADRRAVEAVRSLPDVPEG